MKVEPLICMLCAQGLWQRRQPGYEDGFRRKMAESSEKVSMFDRNYKKPAGFWSWQQVNLNSAHENL